MKKIIILSLLLIAPSVQSDPYEDFSLNIFAGSNFDSANFSENDKPIAKELRSIQRTALGQADLGAFIQGGGTYYTINYGGNRIDAFNLATKNHLGGWKLLPYSEHLIISGEYLAAAEVIAADYGEEFSRPNDPMTAVSTRSPSYIMDYPNGTGGIGCLQKSPLRYGDIENDNKNELVILVGDNLVIFSLDIKKIIFSMHYYQDDEWSSEDVEREKAFHDEANDPQYLAASTQDATQAGKEKLFSAWRSLGKIYVGNFSGENFSDIVLWRKLYESRLNSDPIKGFAKKGDLLVHYKLVNGEYKKQSTDQAVIKSWLTTKQLTWSKGYPNKSECAGQEGQLILEMHDPLLNDPDVLL